VSQVSVAVYWVDYWEGMTNGFPWILEHLMDGRYQRLWDEKTGVAYHCP
jgi:hypothetical protein